MKMDREKYLEDHFDEYGEWCSLNGKEADNADNMELWLDLEEDKNELV